MPLPSLEKLTPHFDIAIPSTGEVVTFRFFLVKEEKLLLIALAGDDEKMMLDAMIQVIEACAMTPLKVSSLATFDIEYIFLQLRAKSVDAITTLSYKCRNEIVLSPEQFKKRFRNEEMPEGEVLGQCGTVVGIKLNLNDVKVQFDPEHNKTIFLTDTMGINLKYPDVQMAKRMLQGKGVDTTQSIAMCVDSVFDDQSVYSNFQLPEITSWIENLTQWQFAKINKFLETMPKLSHDLQFGCPACGYQEVIHLEGLQSFFG